MDIKSLLNLVAESQVINKTTDEEIYWAIMYARWAQENSVINGGHDIADDNDPIEDHPTHHKALQAALFINRYLVGLDNPVSQTLETLLSTFGWQMHLDATHSQVSTHITDCFSFQYIAIEDKHMGGIVRQNYDTDGRPKRH